MKVLVRVPNWIGDAVMSVAALRELRRLYPGDRFTVLCRSWVGGLFEDLDVVDEVLAVPDACFVATRGPRLKCSALIRLARHLKANDYGRAVLFQNAFEAALLACLARIPERIGYGADRRRLLLTASCPPRTRRAGFLRSFAVRTAFRAGVEVFPTRWWPARAGRDHEAYQYLDLLHQTGLSPVDYLNDSSFAPDIRLRAGKDARARAAAVLEQHEVAKRDSLVIVNPGAAYGPARRWPADRFAAAADRLSAEFGVQVLVFGWGQDSPLAEEISAGMRNRPVVLTGPPDLKRTIGLIAASRLLITSDSGPMHLAAALNVPQVALFGSTDPLTTGPLSQSAHVIYRGVECSPCRLRRCPLKMRCWSEIGVDEVVESAVRLLSR
jgi:heptosyltransferase-2